MRRNHRRTNGLFLYYCLLCLLATSVVAPPVAANIGPRWWGTYAAEPSGGLKDVRIQQEVLTIDLQPLALGQPVQVSATYHLDNRGPRKRFSLVFVAGTDELSDFEVRLNDVVLDSSRLPDDELRRRWEEMPASWKPPPHLPGIDRAEIDLVSIRGPQGGIALLSFVVDLPVGGSTLRAQYRTKVVGADEGSVTVTWQFLYVLAPARQWGQFGGLQVTVLLPAGWQHVCSPSLQREGDVLEGRFHELPADALVVSTRFPVGAVFRLKAWLYVGLYLAVGVGGGGFCWWCGRLVGNHLAWRRERHSLAWIAFLLWLFVPSTLLGLLWSAGIVGAWALAVRDLYASLGGQESPHYSGYMFLPACATFVFVLVALPFGIWLTCQTALSRLEMAPPPKELPQGPQSTSKDPD
jgi:hypothetical protein